MWWNDESYDETHDYNHYVQEANNDQTDDDSVNEIIVSVEWENVTKYFLNTRVNK